MKAICLMLIEESAGFLSSTPRGRVVRIFYFILFYFIVLFYLLVEVYIKTTEMFSDESRGRQGIYLCLAALLVLIFADS